MEVHDKTLVEEGWGAPLPRSGLLWLLTASKEISYLFRVNSPTSELTTRYFLITGVSNMPVSSVYLWLPWRISPRI